MLADNDSLEQELGECIIAMQPNMYVSGDANAEDIRKAIRIFMRRHPEIFWFSHQYFVDWIESRVYFRYNFTKKKKEFYENQIARVVEENFQPELLVNLSEPEKVAYVYKWLVNNCTYNPLSSFNQTIYSVLINRNSVCTGYAKTAQYLLKMLGVESELIAGKFHKDETPDGRHIWNVVKIDGEWYHVDFALADASLGHLLNKDEHFEMHDGVLWNYFCKATSYILKNRSIESGESFAECNNNLSERNNDFRKIKDIKLNRPKTRTGACKSMSGSTSGIYLDYYDKHQVIKMNYLNHALSDNEKTVLERLSNCPHIVKMRDKCCGELCLEQLVPWSELLNSHYYKVTESDLLDILKQLTRGLIECRENGYTYYDIHYNNVLVASGGLFKWCDLGLAFPLRYDSSLPVNNKVGTYPMGSEWFMAPETISDDVYSESSAIYALCMMAFFVMNKMRPPFLSDSIDDCRALKFKLSGEKVWLPKSAGFPLLGEIVCEILNSPADSRVKTFEGFLDILERVETSHLFLTFSRDTASAMSPDKTAPESFADSDSFARTMGVRESAQGNVSYSAASPEKKASLFKRLLGRVKRKAAVEASVYAPSQIALRNRYMIRAFVHLPEEAEKIDMNVAQIDPTSSKKANNTLPIDVRRGDKITVSLSLSGDAEIDCETQSQIWRGRYLEFNFACRVNDDADGFDVLGKIVVAVNGVPAGQLTFIQGIRYATPTLHAKATAKKFTRIFISYAHADYPQVKGIAEGCRINGTDYFFDRHTLQAGDCFKDKIFGYIDGADLFVLCWSKNAAESEWVKIEREYALDIIRRGRNSLTLYPLSLPPEAPLPADMADTYHFANL